MNRLLAISQPGCRPCIALKNYLNDKEVSFDSVDVSQDRSLIDKYNLSSTPVLLLLDEEGIVIGRVNGFEPSDTSPIDDLISQL